MDERIHKWLLDIKKALDEIDYFLENRKQDFFEYQKDILLKRAVERDLEIIGEAMNRIITRDPNYESHIAEARNIIGLRNQVIHAYDNISDENVWAILINHLPQLRKDINDLLGD